MKKKSHIVIILLLLTSGFCYGQEPVDLQMISRIKAEGFQNSQVMETLSYLTDVFGPRLTGSPNLTNACEWTCDKLTEWGLVNAELESWGTFGRGWSLEKSSIEMTEPYYSPLIAYPKAWTPGTDGIITGIPMLVDVQSPADFDIYRGKLKDAIVLIKEYDIVKTPFEPLAKRHNHKKLDELSIAPEPGSQISSSKHIKQWRSKRKREEITQFFIDEGVKVILEPSHRNYGIVRVHKGGSYKSGAENTIPSLVLAIEHYNRIARLLEKEISVKLEINVRTRFHESDSLGYNVIAEIPGTDKKLRAEVVMLGAHIDSWHAGTGATDNGSGSAVVMEAVRILKAIGIKPRRTIRIALWTGEEQGLFGSKGYVKKHFGDLETMKLTREHNNFSAYFNLDNGTGKIRGIYMQENDAVRPIFKAYLIPFEDLGATTLSIRNTGGTDHLSFDRIGLPGFQFIQDPIDYGTRTHHTNMDVYDHAIKGDLIQASVIMASFVYHAAMRDHKFPRKQQPKPTSLQSHIESH